MLHLCYVADLNSRKEFYNLELSLWSDFFPLVMNPLLEDQQFTFEGSLISPEILSHNTSSV